MAKVLSQEEIDALLSSVTGGEEVTGEGAKELKKVALYDFKHPNLISKEQMRLLQNIHEGMVRNLGVYLSAQLRMIVDINLLAIDQIMYSEFVMSIATPAATYVGFISDPSSYFVMEISPQLVVFIVERLFGGSGNFHPVNRPVSIIERKIMQRVVERIAVEISKNWGIIKGFDCEFRRFETNPEFVQIVPSQEPVVVISMEVKIRGNTTLINLCYPYIWISNILSESDVQDKMIFGVKEPSAEEREVIVTNLQLTGVAVKAILGKSRLTLGDVINLKNGDIICLDTPVSSKIPIYVENRLSFYSNVGKKNKHYAIKIQNVIKGEMDHDD